MVPDAPLEGAEGHFETEPCFSRGRKRISLSPGDAPKGIGVNWILMSNIGQLRECAASRTDGTGLAFSPAGFSDVLGGKRGRVAAMVLARVGCGKEQ
jgi:hypothetical protein